MNTQKILKCFSHIGFLKYKKPPLPCLSNLFQICDSFPRYIPFENLNILTGIPLQIDSDSVFSKIIVEHRGGICFEINGLLHDLLKALGYNVYFIEARMMVNGALREQANHMALVVTLDSQQYLVDPADGRGMNIPIAFDHQDKVDTCGCIHRLYSRKGGEFALELDHHNTREIRYVFKNKPVDRIDFSRAVDFIQSDPESVFHQQLMVSRIVNGERQSLSANNLTLTNAHGKKQFPYAPEIRLKLLKENFALNLF